MAGFTETNTAVAVYDDPALKKLNEIYNYLTKQSSESTRRSNSLNSQIDGLSHGQAEGNRDRNRNAASNSSNNRAVQNALRGIQRSGAKSAAAEKSNRAVQNALLGNIKDNNKKQNTILNKLSSIADRAFRGILDKLSNGFKSSLESYDRLASIMRKNNLSRAEKDRAQAKANEAVAFAESNYNGALSRDDLVNTIEGLMGLGKNTDNFNEKELSAIAMLTKTGSMDIKDALDLVNSSNLDSLQATLNSQAGADPRVLSAAVEGFKTLNEDQKRLMGGNQKAFQKVLDQTKDLTADVGKTMSTDVLAKFAATQAVAQDPRAVVKLTEEQKYTAIAFKSYEKDASKKLGDTIKNTSNESLAILSDKLPGVINGIGVTKDAKDLGKSTGQTVRSLEESKQARRDNAGKSLIQQYLDRIVRKIDSLTGGALSKLANRLNIVFGDSVTLGTIMSGLTGGILWLTTKFPILQKLAMIGGIAYLIKNRDKLKPILQPLLECIQALIPPELFKFMKSSYTKIINILKPIFSRLRQFFDEISPVAKGISKASATKLNKKDLAASFGSAAGDIAIHIGKVLSDALPKILKGVGAALDKLKTFLIANAPKIKEYITTTLAPAILELANKIKDLLPILWDTVGKPLYEQLKPFIMDNLPLVIGGALLTILGPGTTLELALKAVPMVFDVVKGIVKFIPKIINFMVKILPRIGRILFSALRFLAPIVGPILGVALAAAGGFKIGELIANKLFPEQMRQIEENGGWLNSLQQIWLDTKYEILYPLWDTLVGGFDVCVGWIKAAGETVWNAINWISDFIGGWLAHIVTVVVQKIEWVIARAKLFIADAKVWLFENVSKPLIELIKNTVSPILHAIDSIYNTILDLYIAFQKTRFGDHWDDDQAAKYKAENSLNLEGKFNTFMDTFAAGQEAQLKAEQDLAKAQLAAVEANQQAEDNKFELFRRELSDRKIVAENQAVSVSEYKNKKELERLDQRNAEYAALQKKIADSKKEEATVNIEMPPGVDSTNFAKAAESLQEAAASMNELPQMENGGRLNRAQAAIFAEKGPEAVLPLTKPDQMQKVVNSMSQSEKSALAGALGIDYNTAVERLNSWQGGRLKPAKFVEMFGPIAREDMRHTGMPASITIAQAALETGWGKSAHSDFRNLFGIKGVGNAGSRYVDTHEVRAGGVVERKKDNFAQYKSYLDSVTAHSKYLLEAVRKKGVSGLRYGAAMQHIFEPNLFAYLLRECGYATSSNYGGKLVGLMKSHKMYDWDLGPSQLSLDMIGSTQKELMKQAVSNVQSNSSVSDELMARLISDENARMQERAAKEGKTFKPTGMISASGPGSQSYNMSSASSPIEAAIAAAISPEYYDKLLENLDDVELLSDTMKGWLNPQDSSIQLADEEVKLSDYANEQVNHLKGSIADGITAVKANARGEDLYDIIKLFGNWNNFSKDSAISREMLAALISISQDIRALVLANKTANLKAVSRPSTQNFTGR